MNWTEIILSLLTLISTGGWMVNRRKYKLDLSTEFAEKFRELIVKPLEAEVEKLRNEVKELRLPCTFSQIFLLNCFFP